MSIEVKEFSTMVDDVLGRITNSTNISNINPGSVIRTLVEALIAEQDIQYYQIDQIFKGMNIDEATGSDLDSLVKILGVVRKSATKCVASITFGRTSAFATDIPIPIGSTVSTYADSDGNTTEFTVTQADAVLTAGSLTVSVECTAKNSGEIYVPANTVTVMNSSILNIEYVTNGSAIYGGTDVESDADMRDRSKSALSLLGKGTVDSLESAVKAVDGVQDAICVDRARGVGTANMIVVTADIPPAHALQALISDAISDNKAAGIDVAVVYPTINTVNISVNTTGFTDANTIGSGIMNYMMSLTLGSNLIINQLERYILNACNSPSMDVSVVSPAANVTATATQIIRSGTITINGVVWTNG